MRTEEERVHAQGKGEMSWVVKDNLESREWGKRRLYPLKMHFRGLKTGSKMKRKRGIFSYVFKNYIFKMQPFLKKLFRTFIFVIFIYVFLLFFNE